MLNPFRQPELVKAEVFASMPARFRVKRRTAWSDPNRQGAEVDSFLEAPAFDRAGTLYVVDIPFGRIFRITTRGEWELAAEYDGWPNGMKLHRDGRLFVADYRRGLLALDPRSGKVEPILETAYSESFKGLNDLHFAANGDCYFTDQGQTGITDPTGRVFRLRANGTLERLAGNVPSPNGITLNTTDTQVYVAVTRAQQVWRLPLMADGQPSKTGVALQLSGGHAGPDGIEMDAENGLLVCHLGLGVWRFDGNGLPTHLVHADGHRLLTNVAFGGPDRRTLFMTDSLNGEILTARLPVAGKLLYGLA